MWNIQDQGALTDMLTTHPYPFWIEHCQFDCLTDFRTLLHATAQTQYYATIGKKPCLVEEIGSMGPMISSDERAAGFLQVNLWSNWAHGAPGVLWWCANEQSNLSAPPYDWKMFERELGMLTADREPKPVLRTMKKFAEELKALNLDLPQMQTDAVCVLSRGQDHWGIAYMTYLLAKQAGLTLEFAYCGQEELPESPVYFLPSAKYEVMNKRPYDALKQRVREGAALYISLRDGAFSEFEELTGLKPENSRRAGKSGAVCWNGQELPYKKPYQLMVTPTRARVLLAEEDGNPLFTVAPYGKGRVYFLNFPVEEMLLTTEKGFDVPYYRFYQEAAAQVLEQRHIRRASPYVGLTLHPGEAVDYAVLVNYTDREQKPEVAADEEYYSEVKALRGSVESIPAYETVILELKKRS